MEVGRRERKTTVRTGTAGVNIPHQSKELERGHTRARGVSLCAWVLDVIGTTELQPCRKHKLTRNKLPFSQA